jgi:hypothetical protein
VDGRILNSRTALAAVLFPIAQEQQKRGDDGRRAILQPARRAAADQVAHDEPEIEAPPA